MVARVLSGVVVWTMVSGLTAVEAAASSTHHTADRLRIEDCESCHQFPQTRTHVTGVRPTFEIPAAYPLAPNGELLPDSVVHEMPSEWAPRTGRVRSRARIDCPGRRLPRSIARPAMTASSARAGTGPRKGRSRGAAATSAIRSASTIRMRRFARRRSPPFRF